MFVRYEDSFYQIPKELVEKLLLDLNNKIKNGGINPYDYGMLGALTKLGINVKYVDQKTITIPQHYILKD
jgi:hypothetical protein